MDINPSPTHHHHHHHYLQPPYHSYYVDDYVDQVLIIIPNHNYYTFMIPTYTHKSTARNNNSVFYQQEEQVLVLDGFIPQNPDRHYKDHHRYPHTSANQPAAIRNNNNNHLYQQQEQVLVLDGFIPQTPDNGSSGGLSKKTIANNLKLSNYKRETGEEGEVCAICLSEFEVNERLGVLGCRHRYHPACIKRWLIRQNVCPLCKAPALGI